MTMNNKIDAVWCSDCNYSTMGKYHKNDIRLLLITLSAFLLYGINIVLDYAIVLIFMVLMVAYVKKNVFITLFFPLMYFESVLVLSIGGSFFRLFEIGTILFCFVKLGGKIKVNYKFIPAILFSIFALRYSSILGALSTFVTMLVLCLVSIYAFEDKYYREYSLLSIVCSAVASVLYSFRSTSAHLSMGYGTRISGTIGDPNYTALLIVIGFVALLCLEYLEKKYRMIFGIILIIGLLRTISLTGISICLVMLLLIMYFKNPRKGIAYALIGVVLFLIFLRIPIKETSLLYGIQFRINNVLLGTNNLNAITSGRLNISISYLEYFHNSIPFVERIIGGNDVMSGDFRDVMVGNIGTVSHNSYIDMLYMIGYMGLGFILGYFIFEILNYIITYKKNNDSSILALAMIKIVVMVFAFTISIFPYRYFDFGFII